MAGQIADWVSLDTLRFELNLHDGDELTIPLTMHLDGAIKRISQHTSLPLIDTKYAYDVESYGIDSPIFLGRLREPLSIAEISYWDDYVEGRPPQHVVSDIVGSSLQRVRDGYWYANPPTGGWPADANKIRITVLCGLRPFNHPEIVSAIVLLVRQLYTGINEDDMNPLWERLVENINEELHPSIPYHDDAYGNIEPTGVIVS